MITVPLSSLDLGSDDRSSLPHAPARLFENGYIILSVFGATWLSQRAAERFFEQMEKRLDARFDTLSVEIRSEIKRLDQRIDSLEKRIGSLEQRINSLEQRFEQRIASIEQRLDRIERQLEAFFKPVPPQR